jgi:putative aminopeptidase FrvX
MKTLGVCVVGLIIGTLAPAGFGQRQQQGQSDPQPDIFSVLRELVETPVESGAEEPIRQKVRAHLPAWTKPEVDEKGNLIVTFGSGTEHLFFVGHLDEVGYVVTQINEDGTLSVERRGGFYDKYYEARPVMIYTGRGAVSGIITPRLDYFRGLPNEDGYDLKDVRVYLGTETKKETEELGIKAGDTITVPKRFVQLAGDRATGRSFDDRTGCTAMLLALMKLDPTLVKKKITFVWTVEEEVGLNGARALAEKSKADYVFAVDTFVSSDSPREDKRFADAPLGRGFVIRALDTSGITPFPVVNRVMEIARRHKIPVQTGTTNGGNDGSTFTRFGAINIPLSWPGRYSHSPIEVMDRNDLEALSEIIHQLVLEF